MKKKVVLKLPKFELKKIDWSRWNFRKLNMITILSILSYLSVLVVIPLLVQSKRTFVKFHVRQGLALLVVWVIFMFTFYVPALPYIFAFYIVISMVIGIVNVVTGHERPLPIIGKLAA